MTNNEDRNFSKIFMGYDIHEVDLFIDRLLREQEKLKSIITDLKNKVEILNEQEGLIKSTILTAQQVSSDIRKNAEKEAETIIKKAEETAKGIAIKAINETSDYKNDIYKIFYGYEHELRLILENFYVKAREHISELEKEFIEQTEGVLLKYDSDFKHTQHPKTDLKEKQTKNDSKIAIQWEDKESSMLIGKKTLVDIKDKDGTILLEKDSTITPYVIKSFIEKGLYGELIMAISETYSGKNCIDKEKGC